ncbi:kinase-like domain-containing protein [Syncephalis plumigaleata]|nr:kinase-like domain-containing protein [Syncephalis plumigaleata]
MHYSRVTYGVLAILALTTVSSFTGQKVDAALTSWFSSNGGSGSSASLSGLRDQARDILTPREVQEIQQCMRIQNTAGQSSGSSISSNQADATNQVETVRERCSKMYTITDKNNQVFAVKVPLGPNEVIQMNGIVKKLHKKPGGTVFPKTYMPVNTKVGPGMAMEYLEGAQELGVYLRSINIPSRQGRYNAQVKHLFSQTLNGIALLHNSGYVHGNLKPKNILAVPGKETRGMYDAKIVNFAWTRLASLNVISKYSDKFVERTPFAAPETRTTRKLERISLKAADIWTLGAAFYYSLTGKYVSVHAQTGEVILEDIEDNKLRILLAKMLMQNPSERCTVAQCLQMEYFTTDTVAHNRW